MANDSVRLEKRANKILNKYRYKYGIPKYKSVSLAIENFDENGGDEKIKNLKK